MAKRRSARSSKAKKVHVRGKKNVCRWKAPGLKKNGKFTRCGR